MYSCCCAVSWLWAEDVGWPTFRPLEIYTERGTVNERRVAASLAIKEDRRSDGELVTGRVKT